MADIQTCAACGRPMPRLKKARTTEGPPPKYCSAGCRTHRPNADDKALEAAILDLLAQRAANKTICPSEAARQVFGDDGLEAQKMERTRRAARRLVAAGAIDILQRGKVVDGATARGPIRLRLRG